MITTPIRRHDLVGNATAGPFTYQFLIQDKSYLQVWVAGALKTVDTHYTVSGVGVEAGGTVTFTAGNEPALNAEIILLGNEPYTQTSDYVDAASFPAASHEESLDKLTRLCTQLLELTTRVPVLGVSDHYNKSALTLGALVAGEFLRVNSLETGIEGATPTTVPSGLTVGGNYDHLTVSGSGVIEWAQQIYNFSSGWVNISRYGNSLSAAVAAIGAVTKVNLVITSLISVPGNVTITENITLSFKAGGGLSIPVGIVVGYAAGSFEVDDIRRQRFFGAGEFNGSNLSEVIPDQWGADYTGTNDSSAAIALAISSLPSAKGGKVKFLSGIYDISDTIEVDRPLIIEGQGIDSTILNMTTNATLQHGILSEDPSLTVRHFTLQMETPLAANQQMHGIRMDLDGSGITDPRYVHYEHIKVRGFNAGLYCDGGEDYAIQNAFYDHYDVQSSGPAADYIGSCAYMNRVVNGYIGRGVLDQNSTGEHGLYAFGCKNITIEKNRIRNATRGEAQAIKCVGDGITATAAYGQWIIQDNDAETCFNGVLCELFGSETLKTLKIHNNAFKTITGSGSVFGCISISALSTSVMNHVSVRDTDISTTGYEGIWFQVAVGANIKQAIVDGLTIYNWSTASAGTYCAVGGSSSGTVKVLKLRNIYADGNTTNGRTIWNVNGFGGWSTLTVGRLDVDYDTLEEVNTVDGPYTPPLVDLDTTPALNMGTVYIVNNTGATSVTAFDNLIPNRRYTLKHSNGNTTYTNGASLLLAASTNWNPANEDMLTVMKIGSVVYEVGRSDNS